ncbi:MAG: response regulator, partial [Nannocystaceae bacterium]
MSIRECVETSIEVLAPEATRKGIELAFQVDSAVPVAIFGDPTRLQQTLVNLLGNAVKFTTSGEVFLGVRASVGEGGEAALAFRVRDTGCGIKPVALPTLFNAFTQEDASTTRRFGGSGLGLTICRRLVEAMGGRITVASEVNVGSTFRFTIPGEPAPSTCPQYLHENVAGLVGRRVLVVDDNATHREILAVNLASWGMLPRSASSGPEALSLVRASSEPFDIVILDTDMPDMNGLTLAAAIRREAAGASVPFVLLKPLGQREEQGPEKGFVRTFLTKPLKPSRLFDALVSVFLPEGLGSGPVHTRLTVVEALPADLRILLAEDNATNQRVAHLSLDRLGLRADTAADGREALQAVHKQDYDLILMDIHMPELDGLAVTRMLRQQLKPERQPYIVAVTASATVQDRVRCREAG